MAVRPVLKKVTSSPTTAANLESRIEQASAALQSLNLSATARQTLDRGTSVKLSIPIGSITDGPEAFEGIHGESRPTKVDQPESQPNAAYPRHNIIRRRDSLDRREALLKGKEGSRQRRRWENGEYSEPTATV